MSNMAGSRLAVKMESEVGMKTLYREHPKAKLMVRKRAAILAAAKRSFLELGYGGTSMEGVAKEANVSIATLYRHAGSKDDLFAAVISSACDLDDESEPALRAVLLEKPLGDLLFWAGVTAQKRALDPDAVALMRTVITEASRFPGLAEMAHESLLGHLRNLVIYIIGLKPEAAHLDEVRRATLAGEFVDRVLGVQMLNALLGLPGPSEHEQEKRSRAATDALIEALG